MKTNELIAALAVDGQVRRPAFAALFAAALTIAVIAVAAGFMLGLGPRADLGEVVATPRFLLKLAVMIVVIATTLPFVWHLGRPDGGGQGRFLFLLAPVMLLAGVMVELAVVEPTDWMRVAVGSNALLCLSAIPLLSAAPLAILLLVLRRGAPARPGFAGAYAGLLSAGLGAVFYAFHCFDDSPLFVGIWYSIAIAFVAFVAALLGRRVLQW